MHLDARLHSSPGNPSDLMVLVSVSVIWVPRTGTHGADMWEAVAG
jgi:hypothetical protein